MTCTTNRSSERTAAAAPRWHAVVDRTSSSSSRLRTASAPDRRSQVRTGLPAGGKRIRTASPSRERVGLSGGNERCRRGEKGSLVSVSFLVRGTGGSNLVPSSGESDELPPARRGPRRISGCPLLGSRGDREDQAQRPDKTVGAKLGRDKNGG